MLYEFITTHREQIITAVGKESPRDPSPRTPRHHPITVCRSSSINW